ncbi:MAG: hypothetical protein M0Z85_01275 [Gammaproteobacteria bacterium]|nr:hypothetical protein [Gammaproteobacteria bacterium]
MVMPKEGTLDWFFEIVVLQDLRKMIYDSRLHYLSFSPMATVVELLGAIYYDLEDFHVSGKSGKRFNMALQTIPSLNRYAQYVDSAHDLYINLRCGMVHVGLPGNGVVFTQRSDPNDGQRHLNEDHYRGALRLILVCEDLYEDIVKAVTYVRNDQNKPRNLTVPFMNPHLSPDSAPVSTSTHNASG